MQVFKATSDDGVETSWHADDIQRLKGGHIVIMRDNEPVITLGPDDYANGFEHINPDALN